MKQRILLDEEQLKLLNAIYEEVIQFHLCREYGAISMTTEMAMDYPAYSRAVEYMRMLDEYENEHSGAKFRREGYTLKPQEKRELEPKLLAAEVKYKEIIKGRRESRWKSFPIVTLENEPKRSFWERLFG